MEYGMTKRFSPNTDKTNKVALTDEPSPVLRVTDMSIAKTLLQHQIKRFIQVGHGHGTSCSRDSLAFNKELVTTVARCST